MFEKFLLYVLFDYGVITKNSLEVSKLLIGWCIATYYSLTFLLYSQKV